MNPDLDKIKHTIIQPYNHILLIFVKNPVRGKVKTRLAATVGEERALAVYRQLLDRTRSVTKSLACDKAVFYGDFIPASDGWPGEVYQKHLQEGSDLGERMERAFAWAFAAGYSSVCIIGSDCHQLSPEIVKEAFESLQVHEVVLGPSTDGGYYLLGMNRLHPDFFRDKAWSTPSVLPDTQRDANRLGLSVRLLPPLTDVDEEKDLVTMPGQDNQPNLSGM